MVEAARLEARAAIALGDCFAIVVAAANDLVLLTGDPEILRHAGHRSPSAISTRLPAGSVK